MQEFLTQILTPAQMAEADRLTIEGGTPGMELMEAAGRAVAGVAMRDPARRRIAVLCGRGNNGGDGFVAARHLQAAGFKAFVFLAGAAEKLKGDAQAAFGQWEGPSAGVDAFDPAGFDLVIDALFGAGLDREITGELAELIGAMNSSGLAVIAADLPSGINGETGAVMGMAVRATATVTFFRKKPGHLLLPGRAHCGKVHLAQIGIASGVLPQIADNLPLENDPGNWLELLPRPDAASHKYNRGHAVAVSGPAARTGAARLAARAALRIGAGLVTVASPPDALAVNAMQLTAIMLARMEGAQGLKDLLADRRINAVVMGPGMGTGGHARELVMAALACDQPLVLDADALTVFAEDPQELFDAVKARSAPVLMTPHGGEFARLFGKIAKEGSKLDQARSAADTSGAIIVYKGADTVIAAPDGQAAINANAPPWLATAGSGDVLAGIITGLLAQSTPAFEAACAGVWLHGEAANRFGPGLIAEDIEAQLPAVLSALHAR